MSSQSSVSKAQLSGALEIRRMTPDLEKPLAVFFNAVREGKDASWFHPHPLNAETARKIANCCGLDLYYVIMIRVNILAYGMLRGWDEGYDVPSLGIAVHPEARGCGLGDLGLCFLHAAARQRNATKIRLKVYKENSKAVALYQKHGYKFKILSDIELLGVAELE